MSDAMEEFRFYDARCDTAETMRRLCDMLFGIGATVRKASLSGLKIEVSVPADRAALFIANVESMSGAEWQDHYDAVMY
jgi:hypothetical protein